MPYRRARRWVYLLILPTTGGFPSGSSAVVVSPAALFWVPGVNWTIGEWTYDGPMMEPMMVPQAGYKEWHGVNEQIEDLSTPLGAVKAPLGHVGWERLTN